MKIIYGIEAYCVNDADSLSVVRAARSNCWRNVHRV